jgi:hypothetical protein
MLVDRSIAAQVHELNVFGQLLEHCVSRQSDLSDGKGEPCVAVHAQGETSP